MNRKPVLPEPGSKEDRLLTRLTRAASRLREVAHGFGRACDVRGGPTETEVADDLEEAARIFVAAEKSYERFRARLDALRGTR